jgi:deoxyribodipyrimidine photo-lyase
MTQHTAAPGVIYWFRNDLRLHDNPALHQAIALAKQHSTWLLPVYVHDSALQLTSPWGFVRTSAHRLAWTAMAVQDVSEQLVALGSQVLPLTGEPSEVLAELMTRLGASTLVCEDIAAPYEEAHIQALQQRGIDVQTVWQSTLMAPDQLPFEPHDVPDEFSSFRRAVERQTFAPAQPLATVTTMPALPDQSALDSVREMQHATEHTTDPHAILRDPRSAFPWAQPEFHGGERAALAHLAQYCSRDLLHQVVALVGHRRIVCTSGVGRHPQFRGTTRGHRQHVLDWLRIAVARPLPLAAPQIRRAPVLATRPV